MAQQLLVWLLAVLSPLLFSKLRPLLYTFSVTFPAVSLPLPRGLLPSTATLPTTRVPLACKAALPPSCQGLVPAPRPLARRRAAAHPLPACAAGRLCRCSRHRC